MSRTTEANINNNNNNKKNNHHHHNASEVLKSNNSTALASIFTQLLNFKKNGSKQWARNNNYRAPFCRVEKSKQTLLYQCIINWNSLPSQIKNKK